MSRSTERMLISREKRFTITESIPSVSIITTQTIYIMKSANFSLTTLQVTS